MALPKTPGGFPTWVYPRTGAPFIVQTPAEYAALDSTEVADHPNVWTDPPVAPVRAVASPPVTADFSDVLPSEPEPVRRGPGRPRKDAV
jgi:hypothetical protein